MSRGAWFACPACGRDLDEDSHSRALRCSSGHAFEVGKRGYAPLVVGRSALVRSEPSAQLDAVDARWGSAAYSGVADAVQAMMPAGAARILDVGGDLGHVLGALRAVRPEAEALVAGSSPSGLVRAMARSGADGVLADPSRTLPIRDGAAGVVLCAFGEHRPAEFHRVLAPGGVLIHAVEEAQVRALDDDLFSWFEHDQTRSAAPGAGAVAVLRYRRRRRPVTW